MTVKTVFLEVKQWLGDVASYVLLTKLGLGILVAVLGGSGLIGMLGELAAYKYAADYGVRMPVEGVPYLTLSVTLISIILLIGSSLVFVYVYLISLLAVKGIDRTVEIIVSLTVPGGPVSPPEESERRHSRIFDYGVPFVFGGGLVALLMWHQPGVFGRDLPRFIEIPLMIVFLYGYILLLLRPELFKRVSVVAVCLYLVVVVTLMFNSDTYSRFLRLTGLGGGKEVAVTYKSQETKKGVVSVKGGMMIRTEEYFIVYDPYSDETVEVPVSNVVKLTYKNNNKYVLPKTL